MISHAAYRQARVLGWPVPKRLFALLFAQTQLHSHPFGAATNQGLTKLFPAQPDGHTLINRDNAPTRHTVIAQLRAGRNRIHGRCCGVSYAPSHLPGESGAASERPSRKPLKPRCLDQPRKCSRREPRSDYDRRRRCRPLPTQTRSHSARVYPPR